MTALDRIIYDSGSGLHAGVPDSVAAFYNPDQDMSWWGEDDNENGEPR